MFAAVKRIASGRTNAPIDHMYFWDCLRTLVKHCNFDVNSSMDEENKAFVPLLLRLVEQYRNDFPTKRFHLSHNFKIIHCN